MSAVTLCIPRVFQNIGEQRIRHIFEQLELGIVSRIDMVSTTNQKGEKFNRVFVHFETWFRNENADRSIVRLQQGNEIKIIYDEPWFWKVSLYRKKEQQPQLYQQYQQYNQYQQGQRPPARLEFANVQVAPGLQVNTKSNPKPNPKSNPKSNPNPTSTFKVVPALPSVKSAFTTPPRNQKKPITPARPTKQAHKNKSSAEDKQRSLPKPTRLRELEEGEIQEDSSKHFKPITSTETAEKEI